jgi:hypothetical protein
MRCSPPNETPKLTFVSHGATQAPSVCAQRAQKMVQATNRVRTECCPLHVFAQSFSSPATIDHVQVVGMRFQHVWTARACINGMDMNVQLFSCLFYNKTKYYYSARLGSSLILFPLPRDSRSFQALCRHLSPPPLAASPAGVTGRGAHGPPVHPVA